ncbi:OsmC family protein [Bdellovibrio sp. SKB1291214]|uniref:OsmC family protein n=1 Tax=Bdellovibrio sp. SKB1291214 TaxID=1732569 RepID=UPI000B51708F|nr:OsmC family protein [Bdellovibrio sp. SKB1291214]UYL07899.1 OsmC family protein [Bdellovibrio sp. SKB1291214]
MGQMETKTQWTGKGLGFAAESRGLKFVMDGKPADGSDQGPSPKEVLLASICACSGMDVVSILQKMRLDLQSCDVDAQTETTEGHPAIFKLVRVQYLIKGSNIKPEQAIKAVTLSMTKYCGVTAMVCPTSPVQFEIFLNTEKIHDGKADFTEAMKESHKS